MRKINKNTSGAVIIIAVFLCMTAGNGEARGPGHQGQQPGLSIVIASLPVQDLSAEEEVGLARMREEEKLARDVYQVLYQKWGHRVFNNIAQSEQRHMDAIKALLNKYNLPDPVTDSSIGVFTSPEMLNLYNSLVEQGRTSLIEALKVGATIEDLDIKDLYEFLEQTDNEDIEIVYQNLAKGSRNHLRAFTTQLSLNGVTYEAQFLTQEQVDDIITSPRERGRIGSKGISGKQAGRVAGSMNGARYLIRQ